MLRYLNIAILLILFSSFFQKVYAIERFGDWEWDIQSHKGYNIYKLTDRGPNNSTKVRSITLKVSQINKSELPDLIIEFKVKDLQKDFKAFLQEKWDDLKDQTGYARFLIHDCWVDRMPDPYKMGIDEIETQEALKKILNRIFQFETTLNEDSRRVWFEAIETPQIKEHLKPPFESASNSNINPIPTVEASTSGITQYPPMTRQSRFERYEKAAAAGDTAAMTHLGFMYQNRTNYQKARAWYEKAAVAGNSTAMNNLGAMYYAGQGMDQPNYHEARIWFEKAAASGNTDAMTYLGVMYEKGQGMDRPNYQEARAWYEKAATAGNNTAMNNLGFMYEKGQGMNKPNYQEAKAWYEKAVAAGSNTARNNLALLYKEGQWMANPQIDPARAKIAAASFLRMVKFSRRVPRCADCRNFCHSPTRSKFEISFPKNVLPSIPKIIQEYGIETINEGFKHFHLPFKLVKVQREWTHGGDGSRPEGYHQNINTLVPVSEVYSYQDGLCIAYSSNYSDLKTTRNRRTYYENERVGSHTEYRTEPDYRTETRYKEGTRKERKTGTKTGWHYVSKNVPYKKVESIPFYNTWSKKWETREYPSYFSRTESHLAAFDEPYTYEVDVPYREPYTVEVECGTKEVPYSVDDYAPVEKEEVWDVYNVLINSTEYFFQYLDDNLKCDSCKCVSCTKERPPHIDDAIDQWVAFFENSTSNQCLNCGLVCHRKKEKNSKGRYEEICPAGTFSLKHIVEQNLGNKDPDLTYCLGEHDVDRLTRPVVQETQLRCASECHCLNCISERGQLAEEMKNPLLVRLWHDFYVPPKASPPDNPANAQLLQSALSRTCERQNLGEAEASFEMQEATSKILNVLHKISKKGPK